MYIEYISVILNLLLGGGLIVTLVTLKATRQSATAAAESASATAGKDKVGLVNDTVTTMINTVNSLMAQNKELIDKYVARSDELEQTKQENLDLEAKFVELEKRVNRMITTNLKVIKALEQLGVDEEIIRQLRDCKS